MTRLLLSLDSLPARRFDTPEILRAVNRASVPLAELKGFVSGIPNQAMLVDTLVLQEAKESSAIENIITTHDELFRDPSQLDAAANAATKEVIRYREAVRIGSERVRSTGLLTTRTILEIQGVLVESRAGFRRVTGTTLRDASGRIVYTPPEPQHVIPLMTDLERFLHADVRSPLEPLVRMALAHHRFESIHPFNDGNGRTGRILNVLYLVKEGLLDSPVLYPSRHIVRSKDRYYKLLQEVRTHDRWEAWVLYMLEAIEVTAREGIATVGAIRTALLDVKHRIRSAHRFYSQDLINHLFAHPYTRISALQGELGVSRVTATKYLDALVTDGILAKLKRGRSSYYVNRRLMRILTGRSPGTRSRRDD
ncbi:MAG: Fic family protein [Gemmatimonadetes bacterium]|nr:Fic family protein [Gemmatimonadota bacterium]